MVDVCNLRNVEGRSLCSEIDEIESYMREKINDLSLPGWGPKSEFKCWRRNQSIGFLIYARREFKTGPFGVIAVDDYRVHVACHAGEEGPHRAVDDIVDFLINDVEMTVAPKDDRVLFKEWLLADIIEKGIELNREHSSWKNDRRRVLMTMYFNNMNVARWCEPMLKEWNFVWSEDGKSLSRDWVWSRPELGSGV